MPRRFFELAIRGRRFIARTVPSRAPGGSHLTARRQLGGELTQFSFRLAFMIDLAYVGIGALGGAAVGRATTADAAAVGPRVAPACPDRGLPITADTAAVPNAPASVRPGNSDSTSHLIFIR